MRVELWHLLLVQPKLGTIQESTTQPPSFFFFLPKLQSSSGKQSAAALCIREYCQTMKVSHNTVSVAFDFLASTLAVLRNQKALLAAVIRSVSQTFLPEPKTGGYSVDP